MKNIIIFFASVLTGFQPVMGQQAIGNKIDIEYPLVEDVSSIDGIIKAFYEVVSGPKGAPRQWERDRSLHHPKAHIVFTGKKDGKSYEQSMSLSEFHEMDDPYTNGFYESEVKREVKRFGNIAHVWSAYETRFSEKGEVKRSGINSIQLYHDGNRWWIMGWMFDGTRADNASQYLSW